MDIFTYLLVSLILSLIFRPKAPKPSVVDPGESDTPPVASADTPIPIVFGQVLIGTPNVVWYGDKYTKRH